MNLLHRRKFLEASLGVTAASLCPRFSQLALGDDASTKSRSTAAMRFGLVTYQWGANWDVPTLLASCEKARAEGVELRTEHAHGVEPGISVSKIREVRKRFADSPVELVGLGCNEAFHHVDRQALKAAIRRAKQFIKLSHDVGGSGVKVKPNDLPKNVEHEKTIEQIGKALNDLGAYAADHGQQVRLEVHGQCAPLPIIASIMQVADHSSVAVCWNCNSQDLEGQGLDYNFHLVENRLGATTHVRQLAGDAYPNSKLFKLLKGIDYEGWLLIEASDKPANLVAALAKERNAFDKLLGK